MDSLFEDNLSWQKIMWKTEHLQDYPKKDETLKGVTGNVW